jgi:hypothetical protein
VLAPLFVKEAERHAGRFDLGGAFLSALAMGSLVFGLLHAAESGWSNGLTIAALLAAAVFLAAFLLVESRAEQPVMPLDLFTSRNRCGGYFTLVGLVATMSAMNYFVSQLMQDVLGLSPILAGLGFLPLAAGILLAGGRAAKLMGKVSAKTLILSGSALIFIGMLWMSRASESTTYLTGVVGPLILFGVGAGAAFTALPAVIMSDVSGKHAGSAASVLEAMQWIGFTLGISVLVTIFGTARTQAAAAVPGNARHALASGMSAAFMGSLAFVAIAVVICLVVIRTPAPQPVAAAEEAAAEGVTG